MCRIQCIFEFCAVYEVIICFVYGFVLAAKNFRCANVKDKLILT